jgi:twitching motility protein PilT
VGGADQEVYMAAVDPVLEYAIKQNASDIHLVAGHRPYIRQNTVILETQFPKLTPQIMMEMFKDVAPERKVTTLHEHLDADFSYALPSGVRFRVNAHMQRESVAMAFRLIVDRVRPLEELNLPEVVHRLAQLPRGLVLVTGETGSGKSTTLAAMIDAINQRYDRHVITLEDPIEYILKSNKCLIEQREVGTDVESFASGLRHVLRQDPDIILVGEMRDLETTGAAITAAETGHLVFSTLHTNSASSTIQRIIDIYPAAQQGQIRSMLSNTLQAVICQVLCQRADHKGMVPAVEILLCNSAVRNLIRENRIFEIPNVIETNRSAGMTSLDTCLKQLVLNRLITREEALEVAVFPEKLAPSLPR